MRKPPARPEFSTRKGTGLAVLEGVDGRTHAARRFREITTAMESDLGGDLTEAKRLILDRVATLAIWLEAAEARLAKGESFDLATYATGTNTLRRLLSDLGLERVAKDAGDLRQYIAGRAS